MSSLDQFRANLSSLLSQLGLSQAQLAERCDLSQSTIGRILRGEASPSLDDAERIAAALDTSLHTMIAPPLPAGEPLPKKLGRMQDMLDDMRTLNTSYIDLNLQIRNEVRSLNTYAKDL